MNHPVPAAISFEHLAVGVHGDHSIERQLQLFGAKVHDALVVDVLPAGHSRQKSNEVHR